MRRRRRLPIATGAVALAAIGLARVPSLGGSDAASETATAAAPEAAEYVVLYEDGVSAAAARTAVGAAGGRVLDENAAIGAALVRARAHGFLERVAAQAALAGAARNEPIGRAPARLATLESVGAAPPVVVAAARGRGAVVPVGPEPLAARQWDMVMINATAGGSQAVEPGRPEVLVGVVDTGIDASHPDLAPNFDAALSRNFTEDIPLVDGPCEAEPDRSCTDPADVDEGGHGTHVAGTIAAAANGVGIAGVAPNVRLVNLRAGQDSGLFFLKPTLDAITYAADHGIDVVNLSFYIDPWLFNCRANPADSPEEQQQQATIIDATQEAVDYARNRGVTVVAALGNEAIDLDNPTFDATSPDFPPGSARPRAVDNSCLTVPAELTGVIGVSALGPSGRKATYSNHGATQADLSAPGGSYGDLSGQADPALGVQDLVLSPYPAAVLAAEGAVDASGEPDSPDVVRDCTGGPCAYWRYLQGTSMAAPHVAGVAALVVSRFGVEDPDHGGLTLPPEQVEAVLAATAADRPCPPPEGGGGSCVGDASRNSHYGEGLVDALAAVNFA